MHDDGPFWPCALAACFAGVIALYSVISTLDKPHYLRTSLNLFLKAIVWVILGVIGIIVGFFWSFVDGIWYMPFLAIATVVLTTLLCLFLFLRRRQVFTIRKEVSGQPKRDKRQQKRVKAQAATTKHNLRLEANARDRQDAQLTKLEDKQHKKAEAHRRREERYAARRHS